MSSLPWVVVALVLAAFEWLGGAGVGPILLYAVALAACVTLPGAVCLRLLCRSADTWLHLMVLGSLLGLCLQVTVYVAGRLAGFPLLPAVLPVLAIVVLSVRPLRERLSWSRPRPVPATLSWAVAVGTIFAMAWVAAVGWRNWAYPGSDPATPNGDEPYQVALIGELRHHFPPTSPYVAGSSLTYHWYSNAHMAAMSWLTGLRPDLILDRLSLAPMFLLLFGAVGVVGWRLSRKASAGAGAVALLALVGNWVPFPHANAISPFDESFLSFWEPLSPSLVFGMAILMLAVWLAVGFLRDGPTGRGEVVLLALAMLSLPGAKATNLPLFGAGLAGVVVFGWWRSRRTRDVGLLRGRLPRRIWWLLAGFLVVFAYAQLILYGGESEGIWFRPLHIATYGTVKYHLGGIAGTAVYSLMLLASWVVSWLGAVFVLRRRDIRRDPAAVFVLCAALAGTLATLVLAHPHFSEDYFVRFAIPLWALAAGWGWQLAFDELRERDRSPGRLLLAGIVAGVVVCLGLRALTPMLNPAATRPPSWAHLLLPYAATGLLALMLTAAAVWATRTRRLLVAAVFAFAFAIGLGAVRVPDLMVVAAAHPWTRSTQPSASTAVIGAGGLAATAWVRDHTPANTLLATNSHWRQPGRHDDNRGFWISAEAERRVLVQGWGYTAPVLAEAARQRIKTYGIGFSDPALLALNDAAFTHPSDQTVDALRARRVTYLVVDDRYPSDVPGLRRVADLRFHAGDYWVFTPRGG